MSPMAACSWGYSCMATVPGIFCAGVIIGGNISGMIFIENARFHGDQILGRVRALAERLAQK